MAREDAMRECPYCLEEIRSGALRCRHCRSFLIPEDQMDPQSEVGVHLQITPLSDDEVAALNIGDLPENTITTIAKDNCGDCQLDGWRGALTGLGTRTCTRRRCITWYGHTHCWIETTTETCTVMLPPMLYWGHY
jgi:hypothetical protein